MNSHVDSPAEIDFPAGEVGCQLGVDESGFGMDPLVYPLLPYGGGGRVVGEGLGSIFVNKLEYLVLIQEPENPGVNLLPSVWCWEFHVVGP